MAAARLVALLLAASALAGCVSGLDALSSRLDAGPVALDADGFAPRVFETGSFSFSTLDVPLATGVTLHADVYVPDANHVLPGASAPERHPTILVMSPYFGAGQGGKAPAHPVYKWLVMDMLPRGYAVVLADLPGMGGSSGCWDFMGPQEQASVPAMIEAVARQPWSDGKVGMIGKSYDAMTQLMGAVAAPKALVTIVPVASLSHAYAGIFMNGVPYEGWHVGTIAGYEMISSTPPAGADDRYPGWALGRAQAPPCAADNTANGNDPTGSYNAYYQARDLRPRAGSINASVFLVQGFQDPAVKPDNAFPFFEAIPTMKKAWLGQWMHDYPNATISGRADLYTTLHRWFDHELKGIDNGIGREPVVDVQDSLGRWRHESTWPPVENASLETLLLSGSGLVRALDAQGSLAFGSPTSVTVALTGGRVGALSLKTEPLATPLHLAGSPLLNLTVSSDRPGGHVIARLFDVNESGGARLVSQGALNLQTVADPTRAMPIVPGEAMDVLLALYPADYVVRAGHALELVLSTVDEGAITPDSAPFHDGNWFSNDPWGATLTVRTGPDASALRLPVVQRSDADVFLVACGTRLKDAEPSCYREDAQDEDRSG